MGATENESVKGIRALIGTFDVLGAKAIYAVGDVEETKAIVSFVREEKLDAIDRTLKRLKEHYSELANDGERLKSLVNRTSSYLYGDTIVFVCDISTLNDTDLRFATEYFQVMAIEIARRMFTAGIPIRGCLSTGTIASYTDHTAVIVAGKSYVDTITCSDNLEFSGVVLTEDFHKIVEDGVKVIDYPLLPQLVNLPCVVKDKERGGKTVDAWCLDWLDDTPFLQTSYVDVRQVIFDSFVARGKRVNEGVVRKIDNTETMIRLMLTHRKEAGEEGGKK